MSKKSKWTKGTLSEYLTSADIELLFFCYSGYVSEELKKGNTPKEAMDFLKNQFIPDVEATVNAITSGRIKDDEMLKKAFAVQSKMELIIEKLKIVL